MKASALYNAMFNRILKSKTAQTTTKVNTDDKRAMARIRAGILRQVTAYNKADAPGVVGTKVTVRRHAKKLNVAVVTVSGK